MPKTTFHEDPKKAGPQDMTVKYDGRTLTVTLIVNTDEDPAMLAERLTSSARGEKNNMVISGVGITTGPEAIAHWNELKKILAKSGVDVG